MLNQILFGISRILKLKPDKHNQNRIESTETRNLYVYIDLIAGRANTHWG